MVKLTNTQRAAIYQAWKDGTDVKDLAKQYSVADKTIYSLITKLNKSASDIGLEVKKPEPKAAAPEPEKIPAVVNRALDSGFAYLAEQIDARRARIEELEEEIAEFEKEIEALRSWREEHT